VAKELMIRALTSDCRNFADWADKAPPAKLFEPDDTFPLAEEPGDQSGR